MRITAKADTEQLAQAALDDEAERVRSIIGDRLIFATDGDNMEAAILNLCREQGLTLAVAESLTGGLIGQRITAHPGASDVFAGSIVTYADHAKTDLLGLVDEPAISDAGAQAMAKGVVRALGADVGVAVTGVAGPAPAGGYDPGTVFMATLVDGQTQSIKVEWPFDRVRTREFTCITVLNQLRLRLLARQ